MVKCLMIVLAIFLFLTSLFAQTPDTVFFEGWENGPNGWSATNGVWQDGIPNTNPPGSAHSGQNCAGTVLSGNYPANANTDWRSPVAGVTLPTISGDEKIELRFWHYFNIYGGDGGEVLLSPDGGTTWDTLSIVFDWNSNAWTQHIIDLTDYAGANIRVGYHFFSNGSSEARGWYIDDVYIIRGIFALADSIDFEEGISLWYASKGVWEVGLPLTNPPGSAHSGQFCAGTVLNGDYPPLAKTRLISPEKDLPSLLAGEELQLRFWHWFNIYGSDSAYVQISANGGDWVTISNNFDWNSNAWTFYITDISAYAGSKVRFAFYFSSNNSSESRGWFVDDLAIVKGRFQMRNPENFEGGIGDWYAERGVWEVGDPLTNPPDTAFSPPNCMGTVLSGNYPALARTRFISPKITLSVDQGEIPIFTFYHWFSIYAGDSAFVQVSVEGGPWLNINLLPFGPNSNGWTLFSSENFLTSYVNQSVRFAFYFSSNASSEARGWYIDDIYIEHITGIEDHLPLPESFDLHQNYPNPFNPTTHIRFTLPKSSDVKIKIYNTLGHEVAVLLDERKPAGTHVVDFDGSNLSSGVYFYKIQAGGFHQVRKMLLIK